MKNRKHREVEKYLRALLMHDLLKLITQFSFISIVMPLIVQHLFVCSTMLLLAG